MDLQPIEWQLGKDENTNSYRFIHRGGDDLLRKVTIGNKNQLVIKILI
jgi:hypothetical protein